MPKHSAAGGNEGPQPPRAEEPGPDRRVEVVEEVMEVEGEEGDEDVEEIIIEEVEVVEEEEEEEEEELEEPEEEEVGEEDVEVSEDGGGGGAQVPQEAIDCRNNLGSVKGCSHWGISSTLEKLESSALNSDGQNGSLKAAPKVESNCDFKHHPKIGKSKVASDNVESKGSLVTKDDGATHREKKGLSHSNDLQVHRDHCLTVQDKGVSYMLSQDRSYRKVHGAPDFNKDNQMGLNSNEDERQIVSRLPILVARPIGVSSHAELPEGNKRPAIICDFFAKGWCIRGNSCRFLHVKDDVNSTSPSAKRAKSTPKCMADDKHDEGLGNDIELKSSGMPQSNCEDGYLSANTDAARWSADGYVEDVRRRKLVAVHGQSSSVFMASTYHKEIPSSYASAVTKESQYMNNTSSLLNSHWNSKLKPPMTSKVLTPNNFSVRVTSMKGLDSNSSIASPLESQKVLDVDAFRSSSLLQCGSSLSGSESDKIFSENKSADPNLGSGYFRFSAYDWEPSEPFRPSFFITPSGVLSSESQYYPFRDGIERHNKRDGAFKLSFSSQGVSSHNAADEQLGGNPGGNLVRECENYGSSLSSRIRCNEYGLNKDGFRFGETAESFVNCENENVKNDQPSDHPKDAVKDRLTHRVEPDDINQKSWDGSRESKALRYFRVSLIDFAKELLRPTWQKGLISKDVHNLIVKKSVDKVLNTLEAQSVPPSEESTKQYLSLNEPKIARMIEGYVEKYGKS